MALLRDQLPEGAASCRDLERMRHEAPVTIGGLVVARQRPGTAKGIVFLLLEDEFGTINLIVPPDVYERHRLTVRTEPLILARGRLEKLAMAGGAINVFVKAIEPLVTPDADVAGVVELAERRVAAAASEAPADRSATSADPSAILADFRGVAPAVQSFAAGRRR
jgi:error-prone DNA polymerase